MKNDIQVDYAIRPIEPIGSPSVISEDTDLESLNDIMHLDGSKNIFREEDINNAKKTLIKGSIAVSAVSLLTLAGEPLKDVINSFFTP